MAKQIPQPEAAKSSRASPKLLAQVTLVNPEYADEPEDGPIAAQGADAVGDPVGEGLLGRSADIPPEALGLTQSTRVNLLDLVEPTLADDDRLTAVRVADINDSNLAEVLANAGANNLVPLAPLGAFQWAAVAGASGVGVVAGAASGGGGASSGTNSVTSGGATSSANGNGARSAQGNALGTDDHYINAREATDSAIVGGKAANPGSQVSFQLKQVQPDGVSAIRDIPVDSVTVNADGSWQLPASIVSGLTDGNYSLTILAVDAQGNRSESVQSFIVDKTPPAAPTVLAFNSAVTDTTPTLAGSASPGDRIHVLSPTGEAIETTVAADGSWSVTPTVELATGGPRSFVITASDAAGNTSAATFVPVSVAIPPTFTAALAPSSDSASAGDSITNVTRPTVSGVGKPGSLIAVATSSGEILNTVAAADGSWSVTLTSPLAEGGPQKISVSSVDANGTTSSLSVPILIDTTAPLRVAASLASASDSGKLGDLITNDTTPTLFGVDANPGDYIRVTSPTGEVMQSVVALDGRWSVTPSTPLPNAADQEFRIQVSDIAGNSGPTSSVFMHIDTSAPALPDAGLDLAYANGSTTAGHTRTPLPTISGHHASPDTLITVTSPTGEVMTVTPWADGTWCLTSTVELAAGGPHLFKVTASDAAGNVSPVTTVSVTVDAALTWQSSPLLDFSVVNDTLILSTTPVSSTAISSTVNSPSSASANLAPADAVDAAVNLYSAGSGFAAALAPLDAVHLVI